MKHLNLFHNCLQQIYDHIGLVAFFLHKLKFLYISLLLILYYFIGTECKFFFIIPSSYRLNTINFSKIYDKLLFGSIVFHSFDLDKFRFNWFDFENLLVIVSALTLIE